MKKLNLKLGGVKDMLSKEQMKKVVGGGYGDPCDERPCPPNTFVYLCVDYGCPGGTYYACSFQPPLGHGGCLPD